MPHVNVHVDASEVLDDLDDDELREALREREMKNAPVGCQPETEDWLLRKVFEHYRLHGNAPKCVRDYIWVRLGKVL